MIRKSGLFLVMLGALALSFAGQKDAVAPLLGEHLAVVFASTNDLATLLALNEVTTARSAKIRRWAWSVLLLAGGSGLGLNTWDALRGGELPDPAAVAVGAGPVVLAWLLSHLMALVLTERREADAASTEDASQQVSEPVPAVPAEPVDQATSPALGQPEQEAPVSDQTAASVAAQPVELSSSTEAAGIGAGSEREAAPAEAGSTAEAAAASGGVALPIELIDRAERLDRKRRAETGGKRGLPYREAPRRLGVRYETARAALIAARARMATESTEIAA
ncbi:hypothetical protein [Saccharopolyspora gregorii]|uniref:hypothetical protein n=1 Tax=Saccharopolyspora gregorii TaxID=33914 RepID=UPI0021AC1902|nr:hypothetical protein [Saccharopolyspora gregorii]